MRQGKAAPRRRDNNQVSIFALLIFFFPLEYQVPQWLDGGDGLDCHHNQMDMGDGIYRWWRPPPNHKHGIIFCLAVKVDNNDDDGKGH